MKKIWLPLLMIFAAVSPAQINSSLLKGKHWAGNYNNSGDTIVFIAHKKYNGCYYQWGGSSEGWEFMNDSMVQKYYNVFCSSESDPKTLFTSEWKLRGDTLEIDSENMSEKYLILKLSGDKMRVKLLTLNKKFSRHREISPGNKR